MFKGSLTKSALAMGAIAVMATSFSQHGVAADKKKTVEIRAKGSDTLIQLATAWAEASDNLTAIQHDLQASESNRNQSDSKVVDLEPAATPGSFPFLGELDRVTYQPARKQQRN